MLVTLSCPFCNMLLAARCIILPNDDDHFFLHIATYLAIIGSYYSLATTVASPSRTCDTLHYEFLRIIIITSLHVFPMPVIFPLSLAQFGWDLWEDEDVHTFSSVVPPVSHGSSCFSWMITLPFPIFVALLQPGSKPSECLGCSVDRPCLSGYVVAKCCWWQV